jgi:AraC-like DNA-binding protein
MDSSFTTIQVLLFIGAAQGFLLALLMLSIRQINLRANRFLAAILIIFCVNITLHTISHGPKTFAIPHHQSIITIIFLLFGPFFYFYVKTLTSLNFSPGKKDILHFVPFITAFLVALPYYIISLQSEGIHIVVEILSGIVILHVIFYMGWTIKLLIDHSRRIKDSFSSLDKINLHWLRFLIIGFTITWLVALYFDIQRKGDNDWDYVWLLVSLLIYIIGYRGLKQPEIFSKSMNHPSVKPGGKKKYEKSALSEDMATQYLRKLESYMKSEKPYLNSDLTLPELANKLSISIHHLSQVINEKYQKNFFEFINKYRVEEAKELFKDTKKNHLNIAAIGYESGFNSNSSFNAVFKKTTGLTPSEYRKTVD